MGADARGAQGPRFETRLHDRRTFLHALYGATLGAVLAACGSSDAEVFAADAATGPHLSAGSEAAAGGRNGATVPTLRVQVDQANGPTAIPGTSDTTAGAGSSPSTTVGETTTSAVDTTATTAAPSTATSSTSAGGPIEGALPAGGTMVIGFTYEQQPGGKNVPPYVAVWIEDGSGNLATTVALWYQQFGRGERWLPDLARWYNVDQGRIAAGGSDTVDAISGPTRSPGSFQVAWDGRVNGSMAAAGTYFVCIESARERGPYSLIRQSVNLDGSTRQQDLSGDGELVNASLAVNG